MGLVELLDKSIEGRSEVGTVEVGGLLACEVISVLLDEEATDYIEQIVDPGQVEDGLVDGDKDQAEIFGVGVFERVLVGLEGGIPRLALQALGALLDEDVVDQAVDDLLCNGGICTAPDNDTRGCDDFESVQHVGRVRG